MERLVPFLPLSHMPSVLSRQNAPGRRALRRPQSARDTMMITYPGPEGWALEPSNP